MTELKAKHQVGDFIEPNKMTVGKMLEDWHAGHKHAVAPKTWQEYGKKMRSHLIPHHTYVRA